MTGEIYAHRRALVDLFISLGAYVEISRSGTGLHIFFLATKATKRVRSQQCPGIEIYGQDDKPIHVTGHALPESTAPARLPNCQAALDLLCSQIFKPDDDRAHANGCSVAAGGCECACCVSRSIGGAFPGVAIMLEKIRGSKISEAKKQKFFRLWAGDTSDFRSAENEGRTEADLALCGYLAFWCGLDPEIMDAAFRQSGLYREKWAEREEYRASTIALALAGKTEGYDWQHWAESQVAKDITAGGRPVPYHSSDNGNALNVATGTQDDSPLGKPLTRTCREPYMPSHYNPCRNAKLKFRHKDDFTKRMIGEFACRRRDCKHCRDEWFKRNLNWCEGIMSQWDEIHVTVTTNVAEAKAIAQQIKRRAAKEKRLGEAGKEVLTYRVRVAGDQTIWFTNVPTTKSQQKTKDEMGIAFEHALHDIAAGARVEGTRAIRPPPAAPKRVSTKWELEKKQPPLSRGCHEAIIEALKARNMRPFVRDWDEGQARFITYRVPDDFTQADADSLDEAMIPGYIANRSDVRVFVGKGQRTAMERRMLVLNRRE